MADEREPPPLFGDEENDDKIQDDDDLFGSVEETPKKPTLKVEDDEDDDTEDIFAEAQTEVPLDSPEREKADPSKDEMHKSPFAVTSHPPATMTTSSGGSIHAPTLTTAKSPPSAPQAKTNDFEEEEKDKFDIDITVTEPSKKGDGMTAFVVYKVNTKTTLPKFRKTSVSVYRRFSDFLGLHDKLVHTHQQTGRIIPPAPEKSVLSMTKVKMSKEEAGSQEFIEKRRASLERFLCRVAKHPYLVEDSDFIEFLVMEGDLPKATSTYALSGAGMLRLFSKVGDSFGKITFKMDETDQLSLMRTYFCQLLPRDDLEQWNEDFEWFEEKQQQVEMMDTQLRKLHASIETLVSHRKELAVNTGQFAKSAAMLGNAEEHTALSRALSQLAEIEEKVDQIHMDQADNDFYVLAELINDYVGLIGSIKDVFHERVKIFRNWKEAEATLVKKRETKAKFEVQRKTDKVAQVNAEISEWEQKMDHGQADFEKISKTIRSELSRFEIQRVKDFKTTIIHYLESLMNSQQQVIKHWEGFLPEAKAIA